VPSAWQWDCVQNVAIFFSPTQLFVAQWEGRRWAIQLLKVVPTIQSEEGERASENT